MPSAGRRCALALACVAALFVTSCGNAQTYKVQGKVLYQNKPAAGAVVTFHRADGDKSIMPNGVVKDDGTFELTTFALYDGVPAGDYKVTFFWDRKLPGKTTGDDDEPGVQILPLRYLKPDTSGVTVTITSKTETLDPFLLTK
jgi:hypothetical protein